MEKEWEKLEKIPAWQPTKVRNKKEEDTKSKRRRRRKSCVQAVMNISSFMTSGSSAASSPIASKSPGMPIASGKPDSRMSVEPSSFDAASTSQARLKDAYLGGLMEKQRRVPSHQEEDSEDSDNPEAGTWYYKEEPDAQNNEAWGQPLAHGASSSVEKEIYKGHRSDVAPLPPNIVAHFPL